MLLSLFWFIQLFRLYFYLFFDGLILLVELSRSLEHTRRSEALVHLFLQIFELL